MGGGAGHLQDYDRGLSDYTGDSDNSNSFGHHSVITNGRNKSFGIGFKVKAHGSVGILTNFFIIRIPWVSLGGGTGFTLTGALVTLRRGD